MLQIQPRPASEPVQSLTVRGGESGWAAKRKPQMGLTIRLLPSEDSQCPRAP